MKNTKRRYEVYSFFDSTGIAAHLTKMAEKGWLIEKMSPFGWIYRRIDPKKITFFISYFPKASEFDPEPTEEQKIFLDFCRHTGWELAASSAQMQIFYNEQENPIPIETDPAIEVETIHRAAKKNFLPTYFLLLLLSVWNSGMFVSRLLKDPIGLLSDTSSLLAQFAFTMLFLLCIVELSGYFIWHVKAKKAAEHGEFIKSFGYSRLQQIIAAVVLVGFVDYIITLIMYGPALQRTVGIVMIFYTIALIILVNGVKQFLKHMQAPRSFNRVITLSASVLLSFAMMGGITFGILRASQNGLFEESPPAPLTIVDLLGTEYDRYEEKWGSRRSSESLLLGLYVMQQHLGFDGFLEYTITEVKLPPLYEFCKKSLLNSRKDEVVDGQIEFYEHFEPVDPTPWQAQEAYRLYWSYGHFIDQYLLCYEKRIMVVTFSWEPTAEQMAIVGDTLSGE